MATIYLLVSYTLVAATGCRWERKKWMRREYKGWE